MPQQSHAISRAGFEKLRAEWQDLKYNQRPAMQKQVQDAAAEGDRSENAPYTYGKMRLRQIDMRLRELDRIVDSARIVEDTKYEDGVIRFGCRVVLRSSNGRQATYSLVGTKEVAPLEGRISVDSPMGKALVGKKQGDTVQVVTPRGVQDFTVEEVSYG